MKITKTSIFLIIIFILGLIYLLIPGPEKVEDFTPLPYSTRSALEGDTIQNTNIAGYFSYYPRSFITDYYHKIYQSLHLWRNLIPPIVLNHPPETAYKYVRDQQESTFLEENVYPLRESLFVNGYESLVVNKMYNHRTSFIGNHYSYLGRQYDSKTTLRFYPSQLDSRIIVYLGIWIAGYALFLLIRKALNEEKC